MSKPGLFHRSWLSIIILLAFLVNALGPLPVFAQEFSVNELPVPGTMVGESVPFTPLALKGLVINPKKPLEFQFIVDTGRGPQDTASVKNQANQLVKYFLAGLTIPEGDLWVNLSPYEKNRIVPEALGQTDLGRDLLAQDYILKQLTASLIYPEKDLGKEFWNRVYAKAQKQFGTTNIPVNTFNKVWILPNQAQVFEHGPAAYVTKATLKVMLDEDYLALQKHEKNMSFPNVLVGDPNTTHTIASQIVREIVIPEITKEVNHGRNFAPLRQIYQALILAKWYKETIQNSLLDAVYTNKNKVAGVNLNDPAIKKQIYNRYLQSYKKGAFNYIKDSETPSGVSDATLGQSVPRKYFSGGITKLPGPINLSGTPAMISHDGAMAVLDVNLEDKAMNTKPPIEDLLGTQPFVESNQYTLDAAATLALLRLGIRQGKLNAQQVKDIIVMGGNGQEVEGLIDIFPGRHVTVGNLYTEPLEEIQKSSHLTKAGLVRLLRVDGSTLDKKHFPDGSFDLWFMNGIDSSAYGIFETSDPYKIIKQMVYHAVRVVRPQGYIFDGENLSNSGYYEIWIKEGFLKRISEKIYLRTDKPMDAAETGGRGASQTDRALNALRNKNGEDYKTVIGSLEPVLRKLSISVWNGSEKKEVNVFEYLQEIISGRALSSTSAGVQREYDRLKGFSNRELVQDEEVRKLLNGLGDLKGDVTLENLLSRFSEPNGQGLQHHLGTSAGGEKLAFRMASQQNLNPDRKALAEQLLKRAQVYTALVFIVLQRWASDRAMTTGHLSNSQETLMKVKDRLMNEQMRKGSNKVSTTDQKVFANVDSYQDAAMTIPEQGDIATLNENQKTIYAALQGLQFDRWYMDEFDNEQLKEQSFLKIFKSQEPQEAREKRSYMRNTTEGYKRALSSIIDKYGINDFIFVAKKIFVRHLAHLHYKSLPVPNVPDHHYKPHSDIYPNDGEEPYLNKRYLKEARLIVAGAYSFPLKIQGDYDQLNVKSLFADKDFWDYLESSHPAAYVTLQDFLSSLNLTFTKDRLTYDQIMEKYFSANATMAAPKGQSRDGAMTGITIGAIAAGAGAVLGGLVYSYKKYSTINIFKKFKEVKNLGEGTPVSLVVKNIENEEIIAGWKNHSDNRKGFRQKRREVSHQSFVGITSLSQNFESNSFLWSIKGIEARGFAMRHDITIIAFANKLVVVNTKTGGFIKEISSQYFRSLHSVDFNPHNPDLILVSSAGLDRILEVNINTGVIVHEWLAWKHGYNKSPDGFTLIRDKGDLIQGDKEWIVYTHQEMSKILESDKQHNMDNTAVIIDAQHIVHPLGVQRVFNAVHPNWVGYDQNGKGFLATFFNTGQAVRINRETGKTTVILNGLKYPHGVVKYGNGYLVTDTGNSRVLYLDIHLKLKKVFNFKDLPRSADTIKRWGTEEWLQFSQPIGNSGLVITIDSFRNLIIVWNPKTEEYTLYPNKTKWIFQTVMPVNPLFLPASKAQTTRSQNKSDSAMTGDRDQAMNALLAQRHTSDFIHFILEGAFDSETNADWIKRQADVRDFIIYRDSYLHQVFHGSSELPSMSEPYYKIFEMVDNKPKDVTDEFKTGNRILTKYDYYKVIYTDGSVNIYLSSDINTRDAAMRGELASLENPELVAIAEKREYAYVERLVLEGNLKVPDFNLEQLVHIRPIRFQQLDGLKIVLQGRNYTVHIKIFDSSNHVFVMIDSDAPVKGVQKWRVYSDDISSIASRNTVAYLAFKHDERWNYESMPMDNMGRYLQEVLLDARETIPAFENQGLQNELLRLIYEVSPEGAKIYAGGHVANKAIKREMDEGMHYTKTILGKSLISAGFKLDSPDVIMTEWGKGYCFIKRTADTAMTAMMDPYIKTLRSLVRSKWTFGQVLLHARLEKGWTQKTAAINWRIKFSYHISQWEKDKNIPTHIDIFKKLGKSIGYDWHLLYGLAYQDVILGTPKTLGEAVKQARMRQGLLTQSEAAKRWGINRVILNYLENDVTFPKKKKNIRLWAKKTGINEKTFYRLAYQDIIWGTPKTLGEAVKQARIKQGLWTQAEAAKKWKVNRTILNGIENDLIYPKSEEAIAKWSQRTGISKNGGIDLDQISVKRSGNRIRVYFDPAQLNELEQSNFKGFKPVITGFKYIQSPFSLLGINDPADKPKQSIPQLVSV